MNENHGTPTIGSIDCPDWCTHHHGERAVTNAPVPGDALAEDLHFLGEHSSSLLRYTRFDGDKWPMGVNVRQALTAAGTFDPRILFWHGTTGISDEPGDPPHTYRTLTVIEARLLAAALTEAADLVSTVMPDRCACGEPISADQSECTLCRMVSNRSRRQEARARLTIVEN